jgi:predicted aspartyl protease
MQLSIVINGARLTALLDSGSTHNFVDTEVTARTGILLAACSGLRVAVANGDHVASPGCCRNLRIEVGKEPFYINGYGLSLGSYDMVLGVQWLESLGPILWDFGCRTMAFV